MEVSKKQDLIGLTLEELEDFLCELDEPRYRARQITRWLYQKGVKSFQQMTDLPITLREKLEKKARIGYLQVKVEQAANKARKWLWQLEDQHSIESVLIIEGGRYTACISSQVGCGMKCPFCATGKEGLVRNLSSSEIIQQVLHIQFILDARVTNVVFMGMGEPLANYNSVIKALKVFTNDWGLGIGQRHITLSTCGIVPGIKRLAQENSQIVLAISLHAPTDELRDRLVPVNRKYPIKELLEACHEYVKLTSRRITMEYLLLAEINDTDQMADILIQRVKDLKCHINLIPFNPVKGSEFKSPSNNRVHRFAKRLKQAGIVVTIRNSRGIGIEAACGQLRRNER